MGAGERSELSNGEVGLVVIVPDKAENSPEEAGCTKLGELYSSLNDVAPVRCARWKGRERDGDIESVFLCVFFSRAKTRRKKPNGIHKVPQSRESHVTGNYWYAGLGTRRAKPPC